MDALRVEKAISDDLEEKLNAFMQEFIEEFKGEKKAA
jgi:hypothetical protein